MISRAEIVDKLARRRARTHYLPNLTRQQVRTAAQNLTNAEWDQIISAVREREFFEVGEILGKRVNTFLYDLAEQDITNALSPDDTLTVQEIIELI